MKGSAVWAGGVVAAAVFAAVAQLDAATDKDAALTIRGAVRDASGAAVPAARATIRAKTSPITYCEDLGTTTRPRMEMFIPRTSTIASVVTRIAPAPLHAGRYSARRPPVLTAVNTPVTGKA